jgi:hypothetical protein
MATEGTENTEKKQKSGKVGVRVEYAGTDGRLPAAQAPLPHVLACSIAFTL